MNDANKAALAALLGITQETHRWLAKKDYVYPNGCGHGNPRHLVGVRLDVSKLPDPLGPDADGVWAVPIMYWLRDNAREPTVCEYPRGWKAYVMNDESEHIRGYAATMTAALLQACLAARVPEVCKILEATHE